MSENSGISIVAVSLGSPEFDQVLALHKGAKEYLGFLPDQGFKDRADAGTLLGAKAEGQICGYVLYDLPANRVTIRHLCIDPTRQGEGIARLLVNELSERHRDRLGVQLECRRDYPANKFWPKVGFRPVGERPGRSQAGLPLTKWLRSHEHSDQPNLFAVLSEQRQLAALDQMVLEDLVLDNQIGEPSRNLLEPWVLDLLELGATDQLFQESNDTSDDDLRAKLLDKAKQFRHLNTPEPREEELASIAALAPAAGTKDHRHVVRAIAAEANFFLTRDGGMLRAGEAIRTEYGIQVLRPDQAIAELDRSRRHSLYEPVALQGTEIVRSRLRGTEDRDFAEALLNSGDRERAADFRSRLHTALSDPAGYQVIQLADADGRILGGYACRKDGDALQVSLMRVVGRDSLARALARQVAFVLRAAAAEQRLGEVVVEDLHLSAVLPAALEAEAYVFDAGIWRARVVHGIRSEKSLGWEEAAEFERTRWPAKVIGSGLPTYMVSIRPGFAERLFDTGLAEQSLFHRELGLGLGREHVYYRTPSPGLQVSAPSRVLWYVSGNRPSHQAGELRAISHIAEVVVDTPKALCGRFERLGVWTYQQVCAATDRNGQAMALRIVDTELLPRTPDITELREAYRERGQSFNPPLSPIAVDDSVFDLLYRRCSDYAD